MLITFEPLGLEKKIEVIFHHGNFPAILNFAKKLLFRTPPRPFFHKIWTRLSSDHASKKLLYLIILIIYKLEYLKYLIAHCCGWSDAPSHVVVPSLCLVPWLLHAAIFTKCWENVFMWRYKFNLRKNWTATKPFKMIYLQVKHSFQLSGEPVAFCFYIIQFFASRSMQRDAITNANMLWNTIVFGFLDD